jgi:hypothetical protein
MNEHRQTRRSPTDHRDAGSSAEILNDDRITLIRPVDVKENGLAFT